MSYLVKQDKGAGYGLLDPIHFTPFSTKCSSFEYVWSALHCHENIHLNTITLRNPEGTFYLIGERMVRGVRDHTDIQ